MRDADEIERFFAPVVEEWRKQGCVYNEAVVAVYTKLRAEWDQHREEWLAKLEAARRERLRQAEVERQAAARWRARQAEVEAEEVARREAAQAAIQRAYEEREQYRRDHPPPPVCRLFGNPKMRLRWVAARREAGMTYREIAGMIGISAARASQLGQRAVELQQRGTIHTVAQWSRPIDMGGPRDVWLEFFPPPDPRFDNMAPVTL